MGNIRRTYPTPDTDRPNCGPRERAMATFKYLMGLEPGDALKHPKFSLVEQAYENQRRLGAGEGLRSSDHLDAAALFREVLGMELKTAEVHPRYQLIIAGLEQQRLLAAGGTLLTPMEGELDSTAPIDLPPLRDLLEGGQ